MSTSLIVAQSMQSSQPGHKPALDDARAAREDGVPTLPPEYRPFVHLRHAYAAECARRTGASSQRVTEVAVIGVIQALGDRERAPLRRNLVRSPHPCPTGRPETFSGDGNWLALPRRRSTPCSRTRPRLFTPPRALASNGSAGVRCDGSRLVYTSCGRVCVKPSGPPPIAAWGVRSKRPG